MFIIYYYEHLGLTTLFWTSPCSTTMFLPGYIKKNTPNKGLIQTE